MNRMFGRADKDAFAARLLAGALVLMPVASFAEDKAEDGYIQLDETVISGNQELPKVLYIVPWKEPSGMPNIELDPEFAESQVFRRLYPPAYRRELNYYQLLEASEEE